MVENNTEVKNKKKQEALLKEIISWVAVIAVAVVLALIITRFVIFKAYVPSGSMRDTIQEGDQLVGWRLFSRVERGDIVIFPHPDGVTDSDGKTQYLIKRVIGLPGETLEIHDGAVYIDGEKLKEDYLKEAIYSEYGPYTIPGDSYFVMGDNRNDSQDAMFWENKFIKKSDIKAKAMFRYYPSISFFKKPAY